MHDHGWLAEFAGDDLTQEQIDALSDRIAELAAHITAASYGLLVLIRRYDETEGWHRAGFKSCARWLSWRIGIGAGAARERVRVARALEELPRLSAALRTGKLSYSVARALTRVATPETEEELVDVALHSTAAQMERLVSAWRATDRAAEAREREGERHRSRELTVVHDVADGSYVIRARVDPEVGAAFCRALEAAEDELYAGEGHPEDDEDADHPYAARRADALGLVSEAALGGGLGEPSRGADRYQVVVHVSAETLAGAREGNVSAETPTGGDPGEPPRVEGGPHLAAETARRLGCDASVVGILEDGEGRVLDVGRKSRTVPTRMRRALEARDGCCRFPGCGSRHTDAHHLTPWAEGGATALGNLALLCRRHHRRVHEDGWRLEGDPAGDLRFIRPDGRELPEVPPRRLPPPEDPIGVLIREQAGLEIDEWTATPDWEGTRMDVDWAISVLHPDCRLPDGVSAETSPPD
ncbi:MAG: DUF222 domain-containing protein [Candidatus Palauibacterales bacterium]|nr:DUF222 domain-containing protein [Candidatus Palauibacterales bacterium]